jgi:hypothetical protein
MLLSLWPGWSEDWLLEHKVSFDPIGRVIYVHPEVTSLDVLTDIYSSWKEWTSLRDNSKYIPAFRTTGGDPLPGGISLGAYFFLQNQPGYDWRLCVLQGEVRFIGNIYPEDANYPMVIQPAVVPDIPISLYFERSNLSLDSQNDTIVAQLDTLEMAVANTANATWQHVIESSLTAEEMTRLILSAVANKLSINLTTGIVRTRDVADTKDRLVVETDANSQRVSVTRDAS